MKIVANVLELCGLGAIVAGCYLLAPWVALIAGGAGLVLVALSLDGPDRKEQP